MVFWAAILVGALFVWIAVKLGFFQTWSLLFSIVISIYLAVYLSPHMAAFAPSTGQMSSYGIALSMIVLAGACFALLYGVSYVFMTGQFKIDFPDVLDILLAGGLGFLIGFLILSFVALVITVTPLADHDMVKGIGLNPDSQETNFACISWCCDRVHSVTQPGAPKGATRAAIDRLLVESSPTLPAFDQLDADPNQTDEASLPQTVR